MEEHEDINPMLRTGDGAPYEYLRKTVRRWANQGILKAYHIGPRGDRRFYREDITNFLAKEIEDTKGELPAPPNWSGHNFIPRVRNREARVRKSYIIFAQ